MKFGRDAMVEFKKSFKPNRKILLKVLIKVGLNVDNFVLMKVSKIKPRLNIMPKKALFPTNQPNCGKI